MVPLNISFRRSLIGDNLQSLDNLVAKMANNVRLNEREDCLDGDLTKIVYGSYMLLVVSVVCDVV
jgi:hypothetical protein